MEDNNRFQYLVNGSEPITKLEVKPVSPGEIRPIEITDRKLLDSIQNALKLSIPSKKARDKIVETLVDVSIYKGTQKIELRVSYSENNGWHASIRGKKFKCEYLFDFIKRLEGQTITSPSKS